MVAVVLPFAYDVEFLPRGARKPRLATVKAHAPFDIPEAGRGDAPVAVRLAEPPRDEAFRRPGRGAVETRSFDGRPYVSLGLEGPVSPADLQEDMVREGVGPWAFAAKERDDEDDERSSRSRDARRAGGRWLADDMPRLATPSIRGLSTSFAPSLRTEAEACGDGATILSSRAPVGLAEAAKAYARSLLFVDGEAWVCLPDAEPFYAVDLAGAGDVRLVVATRDRLSTTTVPFGPGERDEAEAFARRHAEANGRGFLDDGQDIEVEAPSGVHRRLDGALVRRLLGASYFLRYSGRPRLGGEAAALRDTLVGRFVSLKRNRVPLRLFDDAARYAEAFPADVERDGFLRVSGPLLERLRTVLDARLAMDEEDLAALSP